VESTYFNQKILGCLENVILILVSGMFGVEMDRRSYSRQRIGKGRFI
jgi:hypothetical protein